VYFLWSKVQKSKCLRVRSSHTYISVDWQFRKCPEGVRDTVSFSVLLSLDVKFVNTCELQSSTGSSDLDPRDVSILFHVIKPSHLTGSLSLVLVPSGCVKVSILQRFKSSGFYHFYNVCFLSLLIKLLAMGTWRRARRCSAAPHLLGLLVRTPLGAWMSLVCECCHGPKNSERIWCVWVGFRNLHGEKV